MLQQTTHMFMSSATYHTHTFIHHSATDQHLISIHTHTPHTPFDMNLVAS